MLVTQHALYLVVGQVSDEVHSPVAHLQEDGLGLFAACIDPCVAQAGHRLVYVIERYPRLPIFVHVAGGQRGKYLL